jgi:hypothetical protein
MPITTHTTEKTSVEMLSSQFPTAADKALMMQKTPIRRQYQVSHSGTLARTRIARLTLLTVLMCPALARLRSYQQYLFPLGAFTI